MLFRGLRDHITNSQTLFLFMYMYRHAFNVPINVMWVDYFTDVSFSRIFRLYYSDHVLNIKKKSMDSLKYRFYIYSAFWSSLWT